MLMRLGHKALKSTAKTNGQHATRIFYLSFFQCSHYQPETLLVKGKLKKHNIFSLNLFPLARGVQEKKLRVRI